MPVAIPLAVAAASAVGGDISSNVAAKSANANADNKANAARQADAKALQNALAGLASYNKANPSTASQYTIGSAPASVGGGVFSGSSGTAQMPAQTQPLSNGQLQSAMKGVQTDNMPTGQLQNAMQGATTQPGMQLTAQQLAALMQRLGGKSATPVMPVARTASPSSI